MPRRVVSTARHAVSFPPDFHVWERGPGAAHTAGGGGGDQVRCARQGQERGPGALRTSGAPAPHACRQRPCRHVPRAALQGPPEHSVAGEARPLRSFCLLLHQGLGQRDRRVARSCQKPHQEKRVPCTRFLPQTGRRPRSRQGPGRSTAPGGSRRPSPRPYGPRPGSLRALAVCPFYCHALFVAWGPPPVSPPSAGRAAGVPPAAREAAESILPPRDRASAFLWDKRQVWFFKSRGTLSLGATLRPRQPRLHFGRLLGVLRRPRGAHAARSRTSRSRRCALHTDSQKTHPGVTNEHGTAVLLKLSGAPS